MDDPKSKHPTAYMLKLKNIMKETHDLSDNSIMTYMSKLIAMNDNKAFNNLGFLKDKDKIKEYINQYDNLNSRGNQYTAILSALRTVKASSLYKALYEYYKNELNELRPEITQMKENNKMTKKENENWMSWKEVLEVRDELFKDIKPFINEKLISRNQFEKIKDYLILCLYTMIEPRRNADYLNMYIQLKDNLKDDDVSDKNTINMMNDKITFRVYKNVKHMGVQMIDLPEDLKNVINYYIKHHPGNKEKGVKPSLIKLFVNFDGAPQVSINFITKKLERIFKKRIGSSMLRHIYLTDKYGDEWFNLKEKMAESAEAMAHSPDVQKMYLRRMETDDSE